MKKLFSKHSLLALSFVLFGLSAPVCAGRDPFKKIECEIKKCCESLGEKIDHIFCSKPRPITQKDINDAIAANTVFTITEEGYYFLAEDINFDTTPLTYPPFSTSFVGVAAINIFAPNVDLDLCNHTITINGPVVGGIATWSTALDTLSAGASRTRIHNGTILGGKDLIAATGIFLSTNDTIVSDIQFLNITGTASAVTPPTFILPPSTGLGIQGLEPLVTPGVPPALPTNVTFKQLTGIICERCTFTGCTDSIGLASWFTNVIIREVAIDSSVHHGITSTSSFGAGPNFFLENVTISNSGLNGIYGGSPNTSWIIKDCDVSNSVLNGMTFNSLQNLKVINSQIYNSGAHGISVGVNSHCENIEFSDVQIFNAQNELLRVDGVENLRIVNSQLTNYTPTTYPALHIQDVRNGLISEVQVSTIAGNQDGFYVSNSSGLILEDCIATIYSNQSSCTDQSSCVSPSCPIGFNFHGGVINTTLRNSVVSGTPAIGINISDDVLNGLDAGITVENCSVQGATQKGISLCNTSANSILSCNVSNCGGDGIFLATNAINNAVRDNTIVNNAGYGINDVPDNAGSVSANQVFHNFARNNKPSNYNFTGPLANPPFTGAGALDNANA